MRIVIDMQGAQTESRFRGIGRYTQSLTQAMVRNRGEHDIILLLNGLFETSAASIQRAFEALLPLENILVWTAPGPVNPNHSDNQGREAVATVLREAFIASLAPDIVVISSFFEGYVDNAITSIRRYDCDIPVCVIAYDFIPLLNPAQYLDPHPGYAKYYKGKIQEISKADLFLAISESSRLEAIDHLSVPPSRATNIAAACEPFFKPLAIEASEQHTLLAKWGLTKPFILYTGGADERKNLPRLLEAFAQLPPRIRQEHQLLFAGKISPLQQSELLAAAHQHQLTSQDVLFTGFVTDHELVQAYNLCRLFVFPSWHEGFGLPPLEAMACGAPAIAGNSSSLPEVMGWHEALFDPLQTVSITQKMHQALSDEAFRTQLIEHARQQTQKFSWDTSAQTALRAIETVVNQRSTQAQSGHGDPSRAAKAYCHLVQTTASILKKHALLSEYDIGSLAACIAHNERQAYPTAEPLDAHR